MWDALHFWLLDSQCKPTPNHVLLGSHFAFPCSKPAPRPWDLRCAHFSIRDSPFRRHIGTVNLPYGTLLVLRIRLQMESGFRHYSVSANDCQTAGNGVYQTYELIQQEVRPVGTLMATAYVATGCTGTSADFAIPVNNGARRYRTPTARSSPRLPIVGRAISRIPPTTTRAAWRTTRSAPMAGRRAVRCRCKA